jgi:fructose-bisphosphate aldolase class 1
LSIQLWFRKSQALLFLQVTIASPGRGILAMDESNATCGKRIASIGLENTEANRQAYRTLLVTPPGLGHYISGAILFEETLYQSTVDGKRIVDVLVEQGIVPGIKVDKVCRTHQNLYETGFVGVVKFFKLNHCELIKNLQT